MQAMLYRSTAGVAYLLHLFYLLTQIGKEKYGQVSTQAIKLDYYTYLQGFGNILGWSYRGSV